MMRIFRRGILFFCVMVASACLAEKNDWLPITQQDLQIKEVPGNPGAAAIQLYYSNFLDDSNYSEFIYRRIKILTEKGMKFADVEINVVPNISIKDLKARTIRPDGSIVEFTGKPYEKTVFKGHGIKWTVKTFTLPEVTVGSIVEYKYKKAYEHGLTSDNWILQHELFTVKEEFTFKPYTGPFFSGYFYDEGSRLAWVALHVSKGQEPRMTKGNNAELELENVAGFESEEFMPPENNYKASVHFFYINPQITSVDSYWDFVGKRVYGFIESFIGDHKEVRQAAVEAIAGETDSEKQLRRLYARAQQIRNLGYERERTEQEKQKEKLKSNDDPAEILKRGYGYAADITLVFVAMARAAGFDASVLLVSNREESFFSKEVLSMGKLDRLIAEVKLNGKDIYLDPGTMYCPFGMLRWMRTSTAALRPDKKNPTFVTIPGAQQDQAVTHRNVNATLEAGGSLKADVVVQFTGAEALERRLSALQTDEAGRKKQLEDEMKNRLTASASVELLDSQGWDTSADPLSAHFRVEIPGYASAAGKRLLVSSYLFKVRRKDAFAHGERKYPVYFPYAYSEMDVVTIKFPPEYSMEGDAPSQNVSLPYAIYRNKGKFDHGELRTERLLIVNGIFFPVNQYAEVKDFFNKVEAGDEQQAVLRAAPVASAAKGN